MRLHKPDRQEHNFQYREEIQQHYLHWDDCSYVVLECHQVLDRLRSILNG